MNKLWPPQHQPESIVFQDIGASYAASATGYLEITRGTCFWRMFKKERFGYDCGRKSLHETFPIISVMRMRA